MCVGVWGGGCVGVEETVRDGWPQPCCSNCCQDRLRSTGWRDACVAVAAAAPEPACQRSRPCCCVLPACRYKQLLLKQRDIMIALTARLNERDEQIMTLQVRGALAPPTAVASGNPAVLGGPTPPACIAMPPYAVVAVGGVAANLLKMGRPPRKQGSYMCLPCQPALNMVLKLKCSFAVCPPEPCPKPAGGAGGIRPPPAPVGGQLGQQDSGDHPAAARGTGGGGTALAAGAQREQRSSTLAGDTHPRLLCFAPAAAEPRLARWQCVRASWYVDAETWALHATRGCCRHRTVMGQQGCCIRSRSCSWQTQSCSSSYSSSPAHQAHGRC